MHRIPYLMMSMMNRRRIRGMDSDSDDFEEEDAPVFKKQKIEEEPEELKESSLFPYLNTNVIRSYALPNTYKMGKELEKKNLVTMIQLDETTLKGLCFSDESKQREYSISVKFNEEGSISKVQCDCIFKEVMWCPHTVASLLSVINFPDKIIQYSRLQTIVKETTKEQLETLMLNRMIEDVKLLKYIHKSTTDMSTLREVALEGEVVKKDEPPFDVEAFRNKLMESLDPLIRSRSDFHMFSSDSDSDDFGMDYGNLSQASKILEECLVNVDNMYHQKYYGNALITLKEITDTVVEKFSKIQRAVTVKISELWLLMMTNEEISENIRKKYISDIKKYELSSFPVDISYKLIAAREFVETNWEDEDLQSILSGEYIEEPSKPFKEHSMTLITRLQHLKSKMKESECLNLMNFIVSRESKQQNTDKMITVAKEIQKIHPVGAFILYCKRHYDITINYGYNTDTVDSVIFTNIIEFNKKTLEQRNASIPPLRTICAKKLGKELIKQYGNDWPQLTQVYLALADDLQREVAFSLYMEILFVRDTASAVSNFRKLKREGETTASFEYALHLIHRITDDYDYFLVNEVGGVAITLGKFAVDKLFEAVKSKVVKVSWIYEFAKLFEKHEYKDHAFELGLECLKQIRDFNHTRSMEEIPDWICKSADNEKKTKLVFDALSDNPSIELLFLLGTKLSEKKEFIDDSIKLLISGYEKNDYYLYDANEKRNKKYKTNCSCVDCKKLIEHLDNFEKEIRVQMDNADSDHLEKQLQYFPKEFIYHLQRYTGVPVIIIRKKVFSNSNSTDYVQARELCSRKIPELILSLLEKRDSKQKKEHVEEVKKYFVDASSLYTLAKFCVKNSWMDEALDLSLEAAKAPGNFDRNTLRSIFGVLGDDKYKFKLADTIMRKEPKASNFHKLKELDNTVKLDDYIDISKIQDQTIPILLMESKFKEIVEGYKSNQNEKNKYILTLFKECITQELKAIVVKEHFYDILVDYFMNSAFNGYHIEMYYNFPRTIGDDIIHSILYSKIDQYIEIIGVPLLKIRTNFFMNSISSTKPGSYRKFAEWLIGTIFKIVFSTIML
eukprot:gene5231-8842_t